MYRIFLVEEYVEMVLGYLRTEDMSSDMQFKECSLDSIIREQKNGCLQIRNG